MAKGKKRTRATSRKPIPKKRKNDNFIDQYLAGKIVGMDDDDAIALAVFLDDED